MRGRGEATKLKALLARTLACLVDSEWSAQVPLEIGASTTRVHKSSAERSLPMHYKDDHNSMDS